MPKRLTSKKYLNSPDALPFELACPPDVLEMTRMPPKPVLYVAPLPPVPLSSAFNILGGVLLAIGTLLTIIAHSSGDSGWSIFFIPYLGLALLGTASVIEIFANYRQEQRWKARCARKEAKRARSRKNDHRQSKKKR